MCCYQKVYNRKYLSILICNENFTLAKNLIFFDHEYLMVLRAIFAPKSFGQLGEDAVIENHSGWLGLPVNNKGAYLDIGCFHPTRYSNNYRFYRLGSKGYVIDIGNRKKKIWQFFSI